MNRHIDTKIDRFSVSSMFNAISSRYDRINTVLSLGLDQYWRKAVCKFLPKKQKIKLLDCATGTGDLLLTLLKHAPQIYDVVGIDPAEKMLNLASSKLAPYSYKIKTMVATAEAIPFSDAMFDMVTISFGIRNFQDLDQSLKEIRRVLTPKGRLLILEFSHPTFPPVRLLHRFYLNQVVPRLGKWLSQNKEAYTYLAKTIESFPQGESLCERLKQAGFSNIQRKPLSFGIVTVYIGEKHVPDS
jgi:demethylmenaquinone methyltransferase / 2-methoxy-6-polyprenyl-1,4-benzoquinol methylase